MEDLHNTIDRITALKPQTIASDTTTDGEIIDCADAESIGFSVAVGTATDGDYTLQLFEGDEANMSDEAIVPAARVLGNQHNAVINPASLSNYVLGIASKEKRYARMKIVSANTSSGTALCAIAELGRLRASLETDRNPV